MKSIRLTAQLTLLVVATALGCSAKIVFDSSCGAGTSLVDDLCVPIDSDAGSGDVGIEVGDSLSDDSELDAEVEPDVPPDVPDASGAPDSCPAKLKINCSTSCGGTTANCADVKCGSDGALEIDSYPLLPMTIRTPHKPGVDKACANACKGVTTAGAKKPVYGIALKLNLPFHNHGIRVRAGAPWHIIAVTGTSTPFCMLPSPFDLGSGCAFIEIDKGQILIATDDPNAPSRNIVIEQAPKDPPKCP